MSSSSRKFSISINTDPEEFLCTQIPKKMDQRVYRFGLGLFITITFIFLCLSGSVEAYTNYTVGDDLGWFDSQLKPEVDYQKWAAGKEFGLGDFLIFNTDNNHSVVQTYNLTTYKLCDYENALDNDTMQWSSADPSNTATQPVTVAVPLVKEGPNYFFSSDYDGEQCQNGQHLQINVTHGEGLPESLKDPSDVAPGPTGPDSGDDEAAPDTKIPTNFNHPKEDQAADNSDDKGQSSGSTSLISSLQFLSRTVGFSVIVLLSWGGMS